MRNSFGNSSILGCVELRAPTQPSSDPGWQGFTAKSDGELANAQLRMDEFRATLERLKRCSPTNKKGRFPSRPRITERELFDRQIVLEAEETVERVAALEKKRDSICAEQNKLIGQREALTPWLGLDVPLDTGFYETCISAVRGRSPAWQVIRRWRPPWLRRPSSARYNGRAGPESCNMYWYSVTEKQGMPRGTA